MNRNVVQLGQQLLGIWKQLGLNQRISVALAAGVVLVALLSLAFWSSRIDYALLYGRLDDSEAAKVVAYLDESKVAHRIGQGGSAIYVPKDRVHEMRMQLASRGVPRGDGVGFEIFDKPNFGISDFVQRANYVRAVQGELARTIAQLDEVDGARVMIVMPENRLLVDSQKKPTASVFIRTTVDPLSSSAVNSIRFLVANSVEGLAPGQVTVVDNRGNVLSPPSEGDSLVGLSETQLKSRRELETYFSKKAQSMLETVLGPGQAVVRVSAEINTETTTQTQEKFDPDGQVERSSTLTDENIDSNNGSSGGGAPGISANLGFQTNYTSGAAGNTTTTKKKVTNTEFEISKTISSTTQIAGGVKRLTAAVFVAAQYDGTGADRKIIKRPPEELEKLKRIVQNALGIETSATGTGANDITLEEMPFSDPFAEVTRDFGTETQKQYWWDQMQNIAYIVLAVGVLLVFWRMFKRTPAENIPVGMHLDAYAGDNGESGANGEGAGNANDPAWRQRHQRGTVTPEVLNRLVRENPENFMQAIQNWLGSNDASKN